jgi:hypothetical protein
MTEDLKGELIYYQIDLDPDIKLLKTVPISDAHYGNYLFSPSNFNRTIQYLTDTWDAVGFLNGDLCESTLKSSKGDIFKQVGTPQDQRDWMIEKLYPIRKKLLGITDGNHENRIYNETGIDITADIATALDLPYRAGGMLLKVTFGRGNNRMPNAPYVYWDYFTHGYGGARTSGAKAVKVERSSTYVHANAYFMSHDHVSNAAPANYLLPDNRTHEETRVKTDGSTVKFKVGRVNSQRKILVKTNAFLKWGGYSERGGYSPVDLYTPIVYMQGSGNSFEYGRYPCARAII